MEIRTIFFSCVLLAMGSGALSQGRSCPNATNISPCIREAEMGTIRCENDDILFPEVFRALETFAAETDQNYHWNQIYIKNTLNSEIPANAFGNITAGLLHFEGNKARSSIHPGIFSNMDTKLQRLYNVTYPDLSNADEIFQSLRSVQSLTHAVFNSVPVSHIPENVFQAQLNLESLAFVAVPLNSIDVRAFYELDNLNNLNLAYVLSNGTDKIHPKAFEFKTAADHELSVTLMSWIPSLTAAQLDPVDFTGFNGRTVTLDLSFNPELHYLNETTFQPFLEDNADNIIKIAYVGDCSDCRHAWLLQKNIVDTRVINAYLFNRKVQCLSSREFVTLADQNFEHCSA